MNARIELVPGGEFVAVPRSVGSTEEEVAAMTRGEIPQERVEAFTHELRCAAAMLHVRPAAGWC